MLHTVRSRSTAVIILCTLSRTAYAAADSGTNLMTESDPESALPVQPDPPVQPESSITAQPMMDPVSAEQEQAVREIQALEQVVVTAQRREESIDSVPIIRMLIIRMPR